MKIRGKEKMNLMKVWSLLIVMVLFASVLPAEVSLSYGTGEGKLTYMNPTSHPKMEELNPLGPQSFRAFNAEFFVADSLAGRILRVGTDGKVVATIQVQEKPAGLLKDMALVKDAAGKLLSLLVISSEDQEIIQIAPDGKVIRKVGGKGTTAGKFSQLHLVEAAPDGSFAAADVGRQVLALFTADGTFVREVHWEWSGLCFDPSGNICYLKWDAAAKVNNLVVETLDGKAVKGLKLEIGPHTNPRLWSVNKDGETLISYIPPEGFKGKYQIALCDAKGKPKSVKDLIPPSVMTRYLESDSQGDFYLISADFGKAPEGTLSIIPFTMK